MTGDEFQDALRTLHLRRVTLAEDLDIHPILVKEWERNGPPEPISAYITAKLKERGYEI